MKAGHRVIPALLVLSALITSMVILDRAALADTEHITISEPVTISGTVLKPDTYTVTWIGNGPGVQVSFLKGHKTMATASATLVLEKSTHHRSVEMKTMPDNSMILERITFKNKSLVFTTS